MPAFDFRNPNYVYLDEVDIEDGWIALFRGSGWYSHLIQYATGGVHSHVGMLSVSGDELDVLEMWNNGGRSVPLEAHLRRYPGVVDIFGVDTKHFPEWDGYGAVRNMHQLISLDYSWRGISVMALRNLPVLWRMVPRTTRDNGSKLGGNWKFCSEAVAEAAMFGGGVDPVPCCPNSMVSPSDLTRSLLYEYKFTPLLR